MSNKNAESYQIGSYIETGKLNGIGLCLKVIREHFFFDDENLELINNGKFYRKWKKLMIERG